MAELKKIELRKKEREKKTQDLQKLIIAADSSMEARRSDRKATKKKILTTQKASLGGAVSFQNYKNLIYFCKIHYVSVTYLYIFSHVIHTSYACLVQKVVFNVFIIITLFDLADDSRYNRNQVSRLQAIWCITKKSKGKINL